MNQSVVETNQEMRHLLDSGMIVPYLLPRASGFVRINGKRRETLWSYAAQKCHRQKRLRLAKDCQGLHGEVFYQLSSSFTILEGSLEKTKQIKYIFKWVLDLLVQWKYAT